MNIPINLTVCLLNWKRPKNIDKILNILHKKVNIFLWDNSGDFKTDSRVDWQISSSINKGCYPRWWMARFAHTEFVCSYDDDLICNDVNVLQKTIDALKTDTTKKAIGFCGKIIPNNFTPYNKLKSIEENRVNDKIQNEKEYVDMLLGRFILTQTRNIQNFITGNFLNTEDDIDLCSFLAKKERNQFIVLKALADSISELPAPHATWKTPGFFERRDASLLNSWFKN